MDPLIDCLLLPLVLTGIKRTHGDTSSLRLPVTDDIMVVIFHALGVSLADQCFGQHVRWLISVSCIQRSLLSQSGELFSFHPIETR